MLRNLASTKNRGDSGKDRVENASDDVQASNTELVSPIVP